MIKLSKKGEIILKGDTIVDILAECTELVHEVCLVGEKEINGASRQDIVDELHRQLTEQFSKEKQDD